MQNRRTFIKSAALATSGLLLSRDVLAIDGLQKNACSIAIGMQLYSVKDFVEKDLKGTLKLLANIGYKEIESYPGIGGHYFGLEPTEFKSMLNDFGLTLVSSHFNAGYFGQTITNWHQATILQKFPELIEKAMETGQKFLTCASLDARMCESKDSLKKTAEMFNKTGESLKKAGIQFAYHNHAFEFKKVDDVIIFDYLVENTDPDLVKWELDVFWVLAAGFNPVDYLKKYSTRITLSHIKDMNKNDKTKNTEIGTGLLNIDEIIKACKAGVMKHYFVEQENFSIPAMESMKINFNNLSQALCKNPTVTQDLLQLKK